MIIACHERIIDGQSLSRKMMILASLGRDIDDNKLKYSVSTGMKELIKGTKFIQIINVLFKER